jgi:hypothetical protein
MLGWTLPFVPLSFSGGQLLERSNALIRNNCEAKTKENSQENQRGPKKPCDTSEHEAK